MKLHANAALSLKQRRRMVPGCRAGLVATKAAAAAEVSARVAARVPLVVLVESDLGAAVTAVTDTKQQHARSAAGSAAGSA